MEREPSTTGQADYPAKTGQKAQLHIIQNLIPNDLAKIQ
jgi:hypothetical protein